MTGVDDAAQASYDESPSMRKPPTARGSREKVSRGYASGGGGGRHEPLEGVDIRRGLSRGDFYCCHHYQRRLGR